MPVPNLRGQVGLRNGSTQVANYASDQVTVAELLRKISTADGGRQEVWPLTPLINDRTCNPDLAKAIKDFQLFWKAKNKVRVVDGIVDPLGTSLKLMYGLATKQNPNPGPFVPPSGVMPTPADFAAVTFDPPIFAGIGVKVSLADPLLASVVRAQLKFIGIDLPHGYDFVLVGMNRIRSMKLGDISIYSGILLGVTPRRGAVKYGLDKLIAAARSAKVHPKIIQILQSLQVTLPDATSVAIAAGLVGVAAKGFDSTRAMHGYRSTSGDELSWSLAIGGKIDGIIDAILTLAELLKEGPGTDGWQLLDLGRKLSDSKSKSIVARDVPGLGAGIDVGLSVGSATWYALDIDALLARFRELQGDLLNSGGLVF